jgi:hypothetical protein
VEGGHHPAGAQRRECRVAREGVGIAQLEDVMVGRALRKLRWQRNAAARGPVREPRAVPSDDGGAARLQALELVELHLEDRGENVRENVAAALGDPGVLVDLAAQERAAVRALLTGDLGTLGQLRVRDSERAALAAAHVLRLVEAEAARVAEGAERAPAPACRDALRRILDQPEVPAARDSEQGVHVGRDPRIVHRQQSRRPGRDAPLDILGVEAERALLDIGEHRTRADAQHRVGARDEGEGRADHLVAPADAERQQRQLERVGAGGRQHHARRREKSRQAGLDAAAGGTVAARLDGERGPHGLDLALVVARTAERDGGAGELLHLGWIIPPGCRPLPAC